MAMHTEHCPDTGAVVPPDVYDPNVNALRFLALDAVNRANSGHPGTPLDVAPVIYRLFTRHLRQLGSKCAGHPERGLAPGIEVTTGPLGQGVANAVGLAVAERLLAARFNRPGHEVVNHYTYIECGDGDLMEGISAEACSLAGHLGLGKLIAFYDDNEVTLDGPVSWSSSEDITTRFLAQGWHVVRLGEDGTTHQPVEHLAGLRAMPNLLVIRPADANETAQAVAVTLEQGRPTALVLSRQDLPVLDPAAVDVRGAVLAGGDDAAIVATGSEVAIALAARQLLLEEGVRARVVSLPSFELFRQRPELERRSILPPELPAVAVEAASPFGWSEFADGVIAMTTFGASAKAADLFPHFGITPDAVAHAVRTLRAERGAPTQRPQ